jgi:hypothetical protein
MMPILETLGLFLRSAIFPNDLVLNQTGDFFKRLNLNGQLSNDILLTIMVVSIAFIVSLLIFHLAQNRFHFERDDKNLFGAKRLLILNICLVIIALCFIGIHSLTAAYQNWLGNYRPWYTSSFHLSIILLIAFSAFISHFSNKLILKKTDSVTSKIWFFTLFLFLYLSILANSLSTIHIRNFLAERNVNWHLLYQFKSSGKLINLVKNGDTIEFQNFPDNNLKERRPRDSKHLFSLLGADKNLLLVPKLYNPGSKSDKRERQTDIVFKTVGGDDLETAKLLVGRPSFFSPDGYFFNSIYVISLDGERQKKAAVLNKVNCPIEVEIRPRNHGVTEINATEKFSMLDVTFDKGLLNENCG